MATNGRRFPLRQMFHLMDGGILYALHSDCRSAAYLNWKEGICMLDTNMYSTVIEVISFAIACFSLGYTLGKVDTPHA